MGKLAVSMRTSNGLRLKTGNASATLLRNRKGYWNVSSKPAVTKATLCLTHSAGAGPPSPWPNASTAVG